MNHYDVAVIDYGVGNLHSVSRALEYWGAKVLVTSDSKEILNSPRVILPGVGAFSRAIAELERLGLDVTLKEVAKSGTPLLGICLGMQLLMNESYEFGKSKGLGLIPGVVQEIPRADDRGLPLNVPHIGWEKLCIEDTQSELIGIKILNDCKDLSMYFVHSFRALPESPDNLISTCNYGGHRLAAVVAKENIIGCQFHPEKSGRAGLHLMRNFLSL